MLRGREGDGVTVRGRIDRAGRVDGGDEEKKEVNDAREETDRNSLSYVGSLES